MKLKLKSIVAALLLAVTIAVPVSMTTGCAMFGSVAEGSRAEVVKAEQFAKDSFALVDAFTEWEYLNRQTVGAGVTQFADKVRREFPPAWLTLRKATKTYKEFPSSENQSALFTARNVVQILYDQLVIFAPSAVEAEAARKANSVPLN